MKIIIVGHHARGEWIGMLDRELHPTMAYIDYSDQGALNGHTQALMIAAQCDERCVIMEDDAIPVIGFCERAQAWMERFPADLISFYLGTGRPVELQPLVDARVAETVTDYITLPTLIHGVCYSIPTNEVEPLLARLALMSRHCKEADYAVGAAWRKPPIYPVESLVEHRDGVPVERHPDGQPRTERRVARRLAAPLAYDR